MRTVVPKIARAIHYSSFAQVPRSGSVQDGNLYPGGVRDGVRLHDHHSDRSATA
jgi:hypothetical protein